jgi:hypothetical protein
MYAVVDVQFIPVGQSSTVSLKGAKAAMTVGASGPVLSGVAVNTESGAATAVPLTSAWPVGGTSMAAPMGATFSDDTVLQLQGTPGIGQLLLLFGTGAIVVGTPQTTAFTVKTLSHALPTLILAATAQAPTAGWTYGIFTGQGGDNSPVFSITYSAPVAPLALPYVYITYAPGTYVPVVGGVAAMDALGYVQFHTGLSSGGILPQPLPLQLLEGGGPQRRGASVSQNLVLPVYVPGSTATPGVISMGGTAPAPAPAKAPAVVRPRPRLIGGQGGLERGPASAPASAYSPATSSVVPTGYMRVGPTYAVGTSSGNGLCIALIFPLVTLALAAFFLLNFHYKTIVATKILPDMPF